MILEDFSQNFSASLTNFSEAVSQFKKNIHFCSNTADINVKSNCFSGDFCQGHELNRRKHTCKNFIMRRVPDQFSSWGPLNERRCRNERLRYVFKKIQGPVQTRYYIL